MTQWPKMLAICKPVPQFCLAHCKDLGKCLACIWITVVLKLCYLWRHVVTWNMDQNERTARYRVQYKKVDIQNETLVWFVSESLPQSARTSEILHLGHESPRPDRSLLECTANHFCRLWVRSAPSLRSCECCQLRVSDLVWFWGQIEGMIFVCKDMDAASRLFGQICFRSVRHSDPDRLTRDGYCLCCCSAAEKPP